MKENRLLSSVRAVCLIGISMMAVTTLPAFATEPVRQVLPGGQDAAQPQQLARETSPADAPGPQVQESDVERFCSNIADAARDRRYVLQAEQLQKLQGDIDARMKALEAKRAEYEDWLKRREDFIASAREDVVKMYSLMRPDAAAERLAQLNVDVAAALLMKMEPRKAGAVLNEMDTKAAAAVTRVMTAASPAGVDDAVNRVERLYADAGHAPVFRVGRESQPPDLASRLEARGYRSAAQTLVMVHEDLEGLAASGAQALADPAGAFSIVTAEGPDDAWLTGWLGVKAASAPVDRELALDILTGSPAAYLTAFERSESTDSAEGADLVPRGPATLGVIRAAFANDWVALAGLAVAPAARRRGLASALTAAAAREAHRRGARRAFLQVEHANAAAITVYERLGFVPADAYHYMEAPG